MQVSTRAVTSITPRNGHGRAAVLLKAIDRSTVTLMVTARCNLACRDCFSPKGIKQLDMAPDIAKGAIDELAGLDNLYYSGGEPFRYRGNERDLFDLLHYSGERVKRVCVDTNGTFLPLDSSREYLTQFPRNTTFVLSVDRYHAEAVAAKGLSLARIFNVLYQEAMAQGLGFEVNMRFPRLVENRDAMIRDIGIDPCLFARLVAEKKVHANSVMRQNAALNLPADETSYTLLSDFLEHIGKLDKVGLFINTSGQIIGNIHAAFMADPFGPAVIGGLRDGSMAEAIWEKLVPGFYSGQHKYTTANVLKRLLPDIFGYDDFESLLEQTQKPSLYGWRPAHDAIPCLMGATLGIDFLIDDYLAPELIACNREEAEQAVKAGAKELAHCLISNQNSELFAQCVRAFFLINGKIFFKGIQGRAPSSQLMTDSWTIIRRYKECFGSMVHYIDKNLWEIQMNRKFFFRTLLIELLSRQAETVAHVHERAVELFIEMLCEKLER